MTIFSFHKNIIYDGGFVYGGEVAEIVTASPDGLFVFYTNASGRKVGVLDITNPRKPLPAAFISVGEAEPTSAAVSVSGVPEIRA